MSATPFHLAFRHLRAHRLRSGLTALGMTVALFLFAVLVSVVTSIGKTVEESAANRLIVESAVSLFVSLPMDYQAKIASVPGVEKLSKFQWFGAYYKEPKNFFAQFGVDHEVFFEQYQRDLEVVEGPRGRGADALGEVRAALAADRRAAVVGEGLVRDFGWKVGDTVPLIGTIFRKVDGSSWDFNIVGVYRPLKSNVDNRTLWFRFDYLDEARRGQIADGPDGVGTFAVNVARGVDPAEVITGIDALFANGPQKTKTTTEAAFQAQFVSMMGNLPVFIGTIGGAVVFAVFFSLINTMLMAARQRVHEAGILKALGFSNGALARLLLAESLLLSMVGGVGGIGLALAAAPVLRQGLGTVVPGFTVEPETALFGLGLAAAIGLLAGIVPAIAIARLEPTRALRSEG